MLVTTAAALSTLGMTELAVADTTGASTATITVQSGVLAITTPATAGSLGTLVNTVGGGTISGPLGQVQVTDARTSGAGAGWVTTVISTAFTPSAGPALAASAIGYTAGTITKFGTATYVANNPGDLTAAVAAVTATGITGDNSATWNPMINVAVPGGLAATSYGATITHSLT